MEKYLHLDPEPGGSRMAGVVSTTVYRPSGLTRSCSSRRDVSASAGRGQWMLDSSTASSGQPRPIIQFCASGTVGCASEAKSNVRRSSSRLMCKVTYSAVPGTSQIAAQSYISR